MFNKVRTLRKKIDPTSFSQTNTLRTEGVKIKRQKTSVSKSSSKSLVPTKSTAIHKMRKVEYNPNTKSVPVPAILHSNEVVLNVPVAKELYKQLKTKEAKITPALKKKLMFLYTHTPK